ncbi:MAG: hypothetical protein M3418_01300 [Gemmatimonadota bacterium]|nr:hypothetical protein [Gemmatimonadota bacterium]
MLLLVLALMGVSAWAHVRSTEQIQELCVAGGFLLDEGALAWEGVEELSPGSLERDEGRWAWARARLHHRCPALRNVDKQRVRPEQGERLTRRESLPPIDGRG